jgi:ABC-2 type transport system permease protein
MLSGSLPLILMGVWQQAATQGSFELSAIQFIQYFLAVWVIWDFEREVVEGQLSFRLLQPIDPGWHFFASHYAERLARFPFVLGLMILFFTLYPQALWWPGLGRVLAFVIAAHLAFCLRFLAQYTVAMLAFWTERAAAVEDIWFLTYLFLSGVIAPLDVFPAQLQAIVHWTPFPYIIYFPSALLVNIEGIDRGTIVQGFLAIGIWMVLFWVLNRVLWRWGLKQYSGMGA